VKITVLLADDHGVVRDGLKHLLAAQPDMQVIGEAVNGREAIRLAGELCPDVIVMDIAMPELNGVEATRHIVKLEPLASIVMLSVYSTTEHVFQAIKAGARGYVLKESIGKELVDAIRAAHHGRQYISRKLMAQGMEDHLPGPGDRSPLDRLSIREREVLQYVVEGWSSAAIAEQLALSPKTVDTYRSRLMAKLQINDIPGLVKFAIQHGITPLT
jgi:DNA-binding NarL/FixJ family response regulator